MKKFENMTYIGNDCYGICYYLGTHQVWNLTEYELYENTTPVFAGNYNRCIEYIENLKINYAESLL